VENAHSSGRTVPLDALDAVKNFAAGRGLPVHMDGARLFNAAVALGCSAAEVAARSDSVMFCLSKGLCAPVGSLLAGPAAFIEKARYRRKIMGGGMRQAGILAAAGIIALTEHPAKLAADHERARRLEDGLAKIPGLTVDKGDINMVFFKTAAPDATEFFRENGILINPPGGGLYRFVTHHWTADAEIEKILDVSRRAFGEPR
jgi:threonine aldolase